MKGWSLLCMIGVFLGIVGCQNDPITSANNANAGGIQVNLIATSSTFSTLAKSAEAVISGVGIDTIWQSLSVTSNSVSGYVNGIPAGDRRKVEVSVFDSTGAVCYYGVTTTSVTPGISNPVSLNLYRYNGTGDLSITGSIIDDTTGGSDTSTVNARPSVTLKSPLNWATYAQNDSILIYATASDTDGYIRRVDLFMDSVVIKRDSTYPYTATIRSLSGGIYSFYAVAYDNSGELASSNTVYVAVDSLSSDTARFNAFTRIEAENYTDMQGIDTEDCSEGTLNVGWWDTGDWIEFDAVNFGTGAYSCSLRVAATREATLEIRVDSPSGARIATANLYDSNGWQNWYSVEVPVSSISGVRKVYVKAVTKYFNVNWFKFN